MQRGRDPLDEALEDIEREDREKERLAELATLPPRYRQLVDRISFFQELDWIDQLEAGIITYT